MTPEQIMAAILAHNAETITQQARDAAIFGTGYGRMTEDGFQHVPYPIDPEVIEGEFRVVES